MIKGVNSDFMKNVYERIEKALTENEEYMNLQRECVQAKKDKLDELADDISDQMEAKSEELCYLQGFNDAIAMFQGNRKRENYV